MKPLFDDQNIGLLMLYEMVMFVFRMIESPVSYIV